VARIVVKLRPHQEAALEKLSNGKILWGGVGTGKSFTAVKYYERIEAPRDVYVITTAKKRDSLDWEREFAHIGVGKESSVHGRLTVDSWNNLQKHINTTGAFFIFDEQRLVGSGSWVKAFIKLARRNHWILLSATPGDSWMDYVPVFVANGFYNNRTDFKREHVVYNTFAKFPKIDRYVGVGKLARNRRSVLVEMPYVRETLRNIVDVVVPYDGELLERVTKQRWHVFEDRPLKDVGELYRVARKVVNSDPRRLAKVAELIQQHPKLIIFYNFDYELELLRSLWTPSRNGSTGIATAGADGSSSRVVSTALVDGASQNREGELWSGTPPISISIPSLTTSIEEFESGSKFTASVEESTWSSVISSTALAEWNGHRHQRIPLEHQRWVYLVQYTAGAEGWNCTDTDTMVFYSLNYSFKIFHQSQGRIDRLNTPYRLLTYYVLGGKSWIDLAIRKSLGEKRDFQENVINF
jgi:hypothetical protein